MMIIGQATTERKQLRHTHTLSVSIERIVKTQTGFPSTGELSCELN